MFWFVLSIICVIAAIAIQLLKPFGTEKDPHGSRAVVIALAIVAFGLFAWGGVKHVPARNIGIPNTFSNVSTDAVGPGYHETWEPWRSYIDVPETIQTTNFEGCWGQYCTSADQPRGNCLEVRIGEQQTACVDVTVQWQVNKDGAGTEYNNYVGQDGTLISAIRDYQIDRELRTVENTDMDGYSPILDAQNFTAKPGSTCSDGTVSTTAKPCQSQFLTFAGEIDKQMQTDLGSDITIVKVLQPLAYYTASTEAFLHSIQNKAAEDQVQIEQQKVNSDTAIALKNLGTPTIEQLEYLCLTSTAEHAAGWTCNFGTSSASPAIAVPAK